MKKIISLENLVNDPGCLSEYDPNAMTIEVARKYIHNFLTVNLETEFVNTKDALDRILGETIISKINGLLLYSSSKLSNLKASCPLSSPII